MYFTNFTIKKVGQCTLPKDDLILAHVGYKANYLGMISSLATWLKPIDYIYLYFFPPKLNTNIHTNQVTLTYNTSATLNKSYTSIQYNSNQSTINIQTTNHTRIVS